MSFAYMNQKKEKEMLLQSIFSATITVSLVKGAE